MIPPMSVADVLRHAAVIITLPSLAWTAVAHADEPILRESAFLEVTHALAEAGTPQGAEADVLWAERGRSHKERSRSATRAYAAELESTGRLVDLLASDPYLEMAESSRRMVELTSRIFSLREAQRSLDGYFGSVRNDLVAKKLPEEIVARHDAAVEEHRESHRTLLALLERLRETVPNRAECAQSLEMLVTWFRQHPATPRTKISNDGDPPDDDGSREPEIVIIDRAELDIDPRGFPIEPPPVPEPDNGPPVPGDLSQTLEIQFTPEIQALVEELGSSPLAIFNWVRNHIEFDPYVGSRRGAAETLRLRAGNDMDQASLLIAMLRAAGFPARYGMGMVEMQTDRATNWLGVRDPFTAGAILATAGLEGVTITDGTTVDAIRCRRVWVEAYLPFSNYRGSGAGDGETLWVRLDPAFKPYDVHNGTDVVSGSDFNVNAFLLDYFQGTEPVTVLEKFEQTLASSLASLDPPLTLEENRLRRTLAARELPWLPAGLPNKLLSVDGTFTEVPADRRYSIRFLISGGGATLDHSVPLPLIAGKQVTLSYIGATQTDRDLITTSGGLFGVPQPWLVKLVPQLRVEGCVVATGTGSVTMGRMQNSQFFFTNPLPVGGTEGISNTIIAGNYEGLAIDTGRVQVDPGNRDLACAEEFTGGFLHRLGMLYLELNDLADRRTASAMQAVLWKGVSNAILSQQIKVAYSGTTPLTFDFAGLLVDADRAGATPFSVDGSDILYTFGRIRGAQSSQNENLVFEQNLGREAVSTIKILRLASLLNIPLFQITPENAASLLPQLNQSTATKNDIIAQLGAGKHVTIPRDSFTYIDWSGTGYIHIDPANGTGGYIIAGGISGGATADEDDKKPGCEKVSNVVITPPAPGNVYSACQKEPVEITVTLTGYDEECEISGTRTIKKTIDPSSVQPQTYDFKFGSSGDCGCAVETVSIIIKPTAAVFTDSDGRQSAGGLLEIAGTGSENITAKAPGAANAQWSGSGGATPSSQSGEEVDFNVDIPNSASFLPGALLPIPALFDFMLPPNPAVIRATNLQESCGTSTEVYGYKGNRFRLSFVSGMVDGKKREKIDKNLGTLGTLLEMIDKVDDIMAALELLAEAVKSPISFKPKGEASIFISDQIKESSSNRVQYVLEMGVSGEYGVKQNIPVVTTGLLGLPPPLAEAAIIIPMGATVAAKLTGNIAFERPAKWLKTFVPQAELSGRIFGGVGARASIASGVVELTAQGTTSANFKIPIGFHTSGTTIKLGGDITFPLGGLVLEYKVGAVWGLWTTSDQWEVFKPKVFPESGPKHFDILSHTF